MRGGWGVRFVINDDGNKNLVDSSRGKKLDVMRVGFAAFNKRIFDAKVEFNAIFSKFVFEYR